MKNQNFVFSITFFLLSNLFNSQIIGQCTAASFMVFEKHNILKGSNFIMYKAKMSIDADGSPRAYGPNNSGLDYTANAGREGNWWGIVTDNGEKDGKPIIQRATDPYPGMYVSATSLVDKSYKSSNPLRYVDAEFIPYIVLPTGIIKAAGIGVGDLAWVYNTTNNKSSFAIYADAGGASGIGEGSMFLAKALGLGSSPRKGSGAGNTLIYVVFPKSGFGQGTIPSPIQIHQKGLQLLSTNQMNNIITCKF